MEYQRGPLGELIEVPPAVLDCGHPNGPRLSHIGFEWSPAHRWRVRTYRCNACGRVTFAG